MSELNVGALSIWKLIKYKNRMIKSAHQKHKKELIPTTSAKQLEEISELSVSLSQSQPSEGSCEGKLGLLECLMGSESLEIQRLSS